MSSANSLGGKPASSGFIEAVLVLALLKCLLVWRADVASARWTVIRGAD